MSAFVVGKPTIDALVRAAVPKFTWYHKYGGLRELTYENATEVGKMLWIENFRSVQHRYPNYGDDLPGPRPMPDPADYQFPMSGSHLEPVAVLKAINCYEYQSCEHPEWEESEAHVFCEALRRKIITELPGYKGAPWEVA